ncbi:MAG: M48 family metalloprotease [Desulfosarcinaceae bacterium]|nr:M48 family metalloprotease [Desulfosarcinaceae bacterium]
MFGNFLYFIVALLIYATYQPSEAPQFSLIQAMVLFLLLGFFFWLTTHLQFQRLLRAIGFTEFRRLDQRFNTLLTRHSILAIGLFAVNIYGLNLTSFTSSLPLFARLPTLEALVFIALFVAYLASVWWAAHAPYQRLYHHRIPRWNYVASNISFSAPVLLPWLILSLVADLINLLPFQTPKRLLASPLGETGYFLFFLVIVAILGPVLIQRFWRCRPLPQGPARDRIEALCRRADLSYNNILSWPLFGGRMITAGVMGLVGRFRYILVTDALLQLLNAAEIDAVIAHEIGHIKRRHLLYYLFFFLGYMVVAYATLDLVIYFIIFIEPVYRFIREVGIDQATISTMLLSLFIIVNFLVYFRYIFGYFMRNFERQADCYVYTLFESAKPLIATFHKISASSGQPPDKPNWHHFSIRERVDYLERCETDRRWIRRQDIKVRRSLLVFLTGLLLVGAFGYQLSFGEAGQKLSARFFESLILKEIEKSPNDAGLYSVLGDIYTNRGAHAKAIDAYERSLNLDGQQANVLNNLAWLLATSEEEMLRDPPYALELALAAAQLDQAPHILDTLAECYYINGRIPEAIRTGQEALARAERNRTYYQQQVEKFEAAKGD